MNNIDLKTPKITNEEKLAMYGELEQNIMDEAEARKSYYHLLLKFGYLMTPQEVLDIESIISEELKHTRILNDMIYRRNNISPENN